MSGLLDQAGKRDRSPKEGGLADRLWAHFHGETPVTKRLQALGIDIKECVVRFLFEDDHDTRLQIEDYIIKTDRPCGNIAGL